MAVRRVRMARRGRLSPRRQMKVKQLGHRNSRPDPIYRTGESCFADFRSRLLSIGET